MIKVFGIGNPLLEDDGAGVAVARALTQKNLKRVEVYITEIYVEDALDHISDEDHIIILDAMDMNIRPGQLSFMTFDECSKRIRQNKFCYERNLLDTILILYPEISGELVGIQIAQIDYKEGLSPELRHKLPFIVDEISKHID